MITAEDGSMQELSNVDLEEEMVNMVSTKNAYAANIKAIQTISDMQESTLDIMG